MVEGRDGGGRNRTEGSRSKSRRVSPGAEGDLDDQSRGVPRKVLSRAEVRNLTQAAPEAAPAHLPCGIRAAGFEAAGDDGGRVEPGGDSSCRDGADGRRYQTNGEGGRTGSGQALHGGAREPDCQ